jgi:hypothetical protein
MQDFTKGRGESNGMLFLKFDHWLANVGMLMCREPSVDLIVFEQAHHRGGAATEIAVGMKIGSVKSKASNADMPMPAELEVKISRSLAEA